MPPKTRTRKVVKVPATAVTRRTRSHTKFDGESSENETTPSEPIPEKEDDGDEEEADQSEESEDESSDDDAPEEESLSTLKQTELIKIEQQKQIESERQLKLKQQRKLKESKSIQQKKEKEERDRLKLEAALQQSEEIPDTLPTDLLESYHESKTAQLEESIKPKKIKFDEEEELSIGQQRRLKQAQIKNQLKQARSLTKNIADKGPVRVKVIEKKRNNLLSVPVSSISAKKDKWLKRKSLGRR